MKPTKRKFIGTIVTIALLIGAIVITWQSIGDYNFNCKMLSGVGDPFSNVDTCSMHRVTVIDRGYKTAGLLVEAKPRIFPTTYKLYYFDKEVSFTNCGFDKYADLAAERTAGKVTFKLKDKSGKLCSQIITTPPPAAG